MKQEMTMLDVLLLPELFVFIPTVGPPLYYRVVPRAGDRPEMDTVHINLTVKPRVFNDGCREVFLVETTDGTLNRISSSVPAVHDILAVPAVDLRRIRANIMRFAKFAEDIQDDVQYLRDLGIEFTIPLGRFNELV